MPPRHPIRHYFYGIALEMSGQAENADEKYVDFRVEAQRKFGDLRSAAAHYAAQAESLTGPGGDEKSSEHYANMARILSAGEPGARNKCCLMM